MTDNLFLISDKDFWTHINTKHLTKGGVYKVIATKDGRRLPVDRFLGTDNDGVLYIGCATSFLDRVIDLKKSIDPTYIATSHDCGKRYKTNPNIAKKFPYDSLYIDLFPSDNPKQKETELLTEYRNTYGEAPPLNAF